MAHIRKHPVTSRPQVRWRDPSGRERSKTFARATDARAYMAMINHEASLGELWDRSLSKTPFAEVAAAWLKGKVGLRRSSWVRDESYLRRHVLPYFGGREVGSITRQEVSDWVRGLCEAPPASERWPASPAEGASDRRGERPKGASPSAPSSSRCSSGLSCGLSPATARHCFRIFRSVMEEALERGLIRSSPCKKVELPRVSSSAPLFLTASQVAALAAAIEPRFRALVLTAAYLGLRWGELAGLRRSCLELSSSPAVLRVAGTLEEVAGMIRFVEETKSRGGRRTLTVPPFLVSELASHPSLFGQSSLVPFSVAAPSAPGGSLPSSEFVFTDVDGGVLRGARFRRRYWKPAVAGAGLPEGLRFHDLRHTCASLLIAEGAHPKEIQARLGHSSIRTTLDTYGHLLPNLGARLDEGLERMFREVNRDE